MPVDCLSRRSFQTIIITMQSELTGENSPEDRLWARTSDTGVAEIEPEIQEHRFSFRDYVASYEFLEFLACVGFVIPAVFLEFAPPDPRQRAIPFQILENSGDYVVNQVYNETFRGETFSTEELMLYGIALPVLIQFFLSKFVGAVELHKTACVYFVGIGLTLMLTNSVKLYAGYLRPIFLDACEPNEDYSSCTSGDDDGARKSWPSGHSSISFCGLGLLSFYLERRFGVSSIREWRIDASTGQLVLTHIRRPGFRRIVSIFCYTPLLLAGWIAASRVVDNKHFPADVVSGALLGGAIAKFIHGLWYPSWPTISCTEQSFAPRNGS